MPSESSLQARAIESLHRMLRSHFADLVSTREIEVRLGRRSRVRLASVRRGRSGPLITLNPLLLAPEVPSEVCDATMAHELCHIVHGFGASTAPRGMKPHRGGIVDAEMDRRGLADVRRRADAWAATHWQGIYARYAPDLVAGRHHRHLDHTARWEAFLERDGMRSLVELERLASRVAAVAPAAMLAGVRWLHASRRQTRLSYCARDTGVVLLHGVLAHPGAPDAVLIVQLAWWAHGGRQGRPRSAGSDLRSLLSPKEIEAARRWERRTWGRFLALHRPV
jgi:hypothetical protein